MAINANLDIIDTITGQADRLGKVIAKKALDDPDVQKIMTMQLPDPNTCRYYAFRVSAGFVRSGAIPSRGEYAVGTTHTGVVAVLRSGNQMGQAGAPSPLCRIRPRFRLVVPIDQCVIYERRGYILEKRHQHITIVFVHAVACWVPRFISSGRSPPAPLHPVPDHLSARLYLNMMGGVS